MITLGLATDLAFIGLLATIVLFGNHRRVSGLLFAEFCIFAGLNLIMEQSMWYDPIYAMMNTAFVFGFMLLKARILALISSLIVIYHIIIFVGLCFGQDLTSYNYYIMVAFSLSQLMSLPGVYNGVRTRLHRLASYIGRDSNGHYCSR